MANESTSILGIISKLFYVFIVLNEEIPKTKPSLNSLISLPVVSRVNRKHVARCGGWVRSSEKKAQMKEEV